MGHFLVAQNKNTTDKNTLFTKLSIACLGLLSCSAFASEARGLAWLHNQSQADIQADTVAGELLGISEVSQTLKHLAGTATSFDFSNIKKKEHSLEGLVRLSLLAHYQNIDAASKAALWMRIENLQNDDGGFAHLKGWQSSSLDTAFVLLLLTETGYLNTLSQTEQQSAHKLVARALNYIATQQQADGSFQVVSLDKLYVSSYVLNALSGYVQTHPKLTPSVQALVKYLKGAQTKTGTWSNTLFIDALVAESLHPYTDGNTDIQTAFKQRVLSAQEANGSWDDDGYTTAIVLDSLKTQSKEVTNPITSSISLTVVDGETNLPLPDATLTSSSDSPSQVSITSKADGKLTVKHTKAGLYKFTLKRVGYTQISFKVKVKTAGKSNVGTVKLNRQIVTNTAQIQGSVQDKKTGLPIEGALIKVTFLEVDNKPISNIQPLTTLTNSKGVYLVVLPQAGKFSIEVEKSGYLPLKLIRTAKKADIVNYQMSLIDNLSSLKTVMGKAVDEQGKAVADAIVTDTLTNKQIAKTNIKGIFKISGLDATEKKWLISKAGYYGMNVSVVPNQSAKINIGNILLSKKVDDPNTGKPKPPAQAYGTLRIHINNQFNRYLKKGLKITVYEYAPYNSAIVRQESFLTDGKSSSFDVKIKVGVNYKFTVSHPILETFKSGFYLVGKNKVVDAVAYMSIKPVIIKGRLIDSQTNKPMPNASYKIFHEGFGPVRYKGKTDAKGYFKTPKDYSNIDNERVIFEVNTKRYLTTRRIIERNKGEIDLGNIRVRPLLNEVQVPNLVVQNIDTKNLKTNLQSLKVSGSLKVEIANKSTGEVNKAFLVKAFYDTNYNRKLDATDKVIGVQSVKTMPSSHQTTVDIRVSGMSQFRGAPIAVLADANNAVTEIKKQDNLRYTNQERLKIPPKGTFEHEIKWHYGKSKKYPHGEYILAAGGFIPMAAPLIDTNGDGKIGKGDAAMIIFDNVAIDSRDGSVLWKTDAYAAFSFSGAIADLDSDGKPEVLTASNSHLHIISNKGKIIKKVPTGNDYPHANIHVADLDADGRPEILYGHLVFDNTGKIIRKNKQLRKIVAAADLTGDGKLEIIRQMGAEDANGKILFKFEEFCNSYVPYYECFMAVGDLNNNGKPEIVTVGEGKVTVHDNQGKFMYSFKTYKYESGVGGAPTIGDFDGDGFADIGVAFSHEYTAYRGDGSILWSKPTRDTSSGYTASTLFDFDSDGQMEVVYADEQYLRVYDAKTGTERIKIKNTSPTTYERPLVLDADADGHADIILHGQEGGEPIPEDPSFKINGIRMISSKNKDWANTRNIWNQYSYHVTNINDDLSVPKNEPNSWEVHNTYHANLLINENGSAIQDLTISYIRIKDSSILGNSSFTARIGNAGGKPVVKGTPVSFYRVPKAAAGSTTPQKPKLLGTVKLSKTLVGGNIAQSYEDVTLPFKGSLADFGEIVIVANDAGAGLGSATGIPTGQTADTTKVIQEYSRSNNTARLAVDGGFVALSLSGSVDKTKYTSNKDVAITAIPKNLGSFTSSPIVKTQILDAAGNVVATLPDQPVSLTSALIKDAGNSKTLVQKWNTGTNRAGNYTARITLWRKPLLSSVTGAKQELVASVDRPFSIVAGTDAGSDNNTGVNAPTQSAVTTDKAVYTANDIVNINSRIQNTANNQVATKRDMTVEVKDPTGKVVFTQTYSYDELPPNALKDEPLQITLKDAKAGTYTVTQTTKAPDGSQGMQVNSTRFSVADSSQTGIGIAGTIAANKAQVELGDAVQFNWSVANTGDVDLTKLPLKVVLYKGDAKQPFTSLAISPADIKKGASIKQFVNWTAVGKDKDKITAILVATFNNNTNSTGNNSTGQPQEKGLAVTSVTLIEPPIEAVINQTAAITDPLLVYYSCESGWYTFAQNWSLGKFNYPCFDVRANYLRTYLKRLNVPHKLVKTPWEFRHELQSGKFGNVWLLGAVEKLTPHTYKELREAAFMGDNVLVDSGMHSWLNHKLYNLAGMNYRGRLQLALPKDGGGNITLAAPLFTDPVPPLLAKVPLATQTRRKGYPFNSNWAVLLEPRPTDSAYNQTEVSASFKGAHKLDLFLEWIESGRKGNEDNYYNQTLRSYPAITQGRYGNGKPVALAFDLINSLTLATSNGVPTPTKTRPNLSEQRWDSVLTQLLKPRQAKPTSYLPLEPVRIPVVIHNKGSKAKTVTVTVDMPQGAMWLDTKGGATLADAVELKPSHPSSQAQGKHSYQVTVAAKSQHSDILTLRLPANTGTHGVRVTVATDNNGVSKTLDQKELRYVVRGVHERIDLLRSKVAGWSVVGKNGYQVLNLKVQLGLIQSHYRNGKLELAVYEAARAGTTFSQMQNTHSRDIKALRLELDELLRALQMQWYQSRNNKAPTP